MTRMLPVCAALAVLPLVGRVNKQAEPTETVIRMKVTAAPTPRPALRYQLLPELREMNPGNAVLGYLKCFMEANYFWYRKEAEDNREKWGETPLKDLPRTEMRAYGYGKGARPLTDADYAARLDHADWEVLLKLRKEGINLLLPEVQSLRLLAGALKVRFRLEVAERRFDDALVTAKTMFAMSRHLGEHLTVIGDLVGIAIAHIAVGPLEEMLQQPGCPSLFWALTNLPDPLIDLRKGLQGERMLLTNITGMLDQRAPLTDAELQKVVGEVRQLLKSVQGKAGAQDVAAWLAERAGNVAHVHAAGQRLVAYGLPEDRVKQFRPLQVVLLDEKLAYEVRRDEEMKALALPYWQADKYVTAAARLKETKGDSLFGPLVPHVYKVGMAQARLQQRLALLRCIEALRMHAAEHEGRLPARLNDVELPLPVDPITGRPFVYRLDGETATIRGTPPAGMEQVAPFNVRYEVTIVK